MQRHGGVPDTIDVVTPLGSRVQCSQQRWMLISQLKHPALRDSLPAVTATLRQPDEDVLVLHRRWEHRWLSAVVRTSGGVAFLVTAYPADKIKAGELLWTK